MKKSSLSKATYSNFIRTEIEIKDRIVDIVNKIQDLELQYITDINHLYEDKFTTNLTYYIELRKDLYYICVSEDGKTLYFDEKFIWDEDAFLLYLDSKKEELSYKYDNKVKR